MCPSDTWMEEGESERQRQTGQDTLLGFAHGQAGSLDPSLTHGAQQDGELAGGGNTLHSGERGITLPQKQQDRRHQQP